MNAFFLVAGVLSTAVCLAHVLVGGRVYLRPLLAATDLHPVPRYVHYYCWHLVTMTLVAMSFAFGYAALVPDARELAVLMTVVAAAFSVWSLALVLSKRQRPRFMPQWALFAPVAIAGLLGLAIGARP